MLPSGLFWTADHCATRFGGYVCKRRSQDNLEVNFENQTVTGTEGVLTSPSKQNLILKFHLNLYVIDLFACFFSNFRLSKFVSSQYKLLCEIDWTGENAIGATVYED